MKHLLVVLIALLSLACSAPDGFQSNWDPAIERPWIGPEFWANPMQEWRVHDGRIENIVAGGDRNVFLLTHEVTDQPGNLSLSVNLGRLEEDTQALEDGWVGFRVGIRGAFDDYRDSAVRGVGLNCGITSDGRVFIGSLDGVEQRIDDVDFSDLTMTLNAEPNGDNYRLVLKVESSAGSQVVEYEEEDVDPNWLVGGLALVSSSGPVPDSPPEASQVSENGWALKPGTQRGGNLRFWFKNWTVAGTKVSVDDSRTFGPILFAMHTLSRGVLKLNATIAPVGNGSREVALEVNDGGAWKQIASETIDPESRTATFRVADWNDSVDAPYRVVYENDTWEGTIRKDPGDKSEITVAAFTGNNDLGFPHNDIVRNIKHHDPDLLAFTGDTIYERVGEYGIVREPTDVAILDYLRKWYIFGWEYGELIKDIPTISMPDDHDVYQGNIWGAGGRKANGYGNVGQDQGGYTMDARFVHVVQQTQTASMPDPFDPTPVAQGIAVYYTDLLVGGVSFAIVEDRKWKDSASVLLPNANIVNGWAQDSRYDAAKQSDDPKFPLLGERQETFLEHWAQDWDGAWMKSVISQTILADVCTLPKGTTTDAVTPRLRVNDPGEYPDNEWPVQDHDSNGWPQSGRDRAVRLLRKAFAFHIAGDQHLGSSVQYGVDEWNDGSWAICVPSVANIWPRRWFPPNPGKNRKEGSPRYSGEFLDGFGNKVTVHAVSNPERNGIEPAAINERAPGYGIIRFNRDTRKISFANWPRWVDASEAGAKPYPGWPIEIDQLDNGMPKAFLLPEVTSNEPDPVVQIIDESNNEIVYTVRINGTKFTPGVRKRGAYTVKIGESVIEGQTAN